MDSLRLIISSLALSVLLCLCGTVMMSQSPAFEVASVKENRGGDARVFWSPGLTPNLWGETAPVRGTVYVRNGSLRDIIGRAYGINPALDRFVLEGGADRLLSTRFDIVAKPGDDAPPGQVLAMLRSLLAERFKLRVRSERQERPIYALTIAREGRLGPKLRASNHDCIAFLKTRRESSSIVEPRDAEGKPWCASNYEFNTPGRGALTLRYASHIDWLISRIQPFVDRPVIDATGLTGSFEWILAFSRTDAFDSLAPSIYTAIQEQLGLRLDRRTGLVDVLVIDSVEMPTPD